jgi:hypothetical protein
MTDPLPPAEQELQDQFYAEFWAKVFDNVRAEIASGNRASVTFDTDDIRPMDEDDMAAIRVFMSEED